MAKKALLQLVVDATPGVKGLRDFEAAANKATRSVTGLADRVGRDFSAIGRVVNTALAPLKVAAGAFVTLKAVTLAAGAASLKAAGDYEMMRQQLRAIIKTKEEADRAFKESIAFSVATPFTPEEIVKTRIALESVGVRGTAAVKSVAEAAAAMGREITDVAAAVKSMEVEPIRNLGIMMDELTRRGVAEDFRKDAEEFRAAQRILLDIFSEKYGGGLEKMSVTFHGLVSTLKGAVTDIRAAFAEGFLEESKVIVKDIIKGAESLKDAAKTAGVNLGDELMRARAGLLAAFDVGLEMAKQIGAAMKQEGGVGLVIHEALKAGATILGQALLKAIEASLSIWRLIGTILGQGVTDALYRSGLPGTGELLRHAVGVNLGRKDIAELRQIAGTLDVPVMTRDRSGWSQMTPFGAMPETSGTWRPMTAQELARQLTGAISVLPREEQLKYAQFDPGNAMTEAVKKAGDTFTGALQDFGSVATAAIQNMANNLAAFTGGTPVNVPDYFKQQYAARLGEGQAEMAKQRAVQEAAGNVPGRVPGNEGASALAGANMEAYKSVLAMEAALRQEYEILTRTESSHEKAARLVEYETALRQANAGSIEEQHDRLVAYREELDKLEGQRKLVQLADDVGSAWGQTWEDMVFGARSVDEAIKGLLVDIARLVYRQTVTEPMANFISSFITNSFTHWGSKGVPAGDVHPENANYAHAGWTVGSGAVVQRAVNPLLFLGAPRLHGGLNWNEYPAILQYGEDVRTPQQRARDERNRTAKVDLHVHNQSAQQLDFLAGPVVVDQGRLTASVFIRDVQTNGPIARTLRGR